MLTPRPVTGLLIKPAGADCDLRCRYCFYLGTRSSLAGGERRMSEETLELVVRQALDGGGPVVSFCWQGGEPTLMGRPFFDRAVELQRRYARAGQRVSNSLQTNGLRLDDDLCDFLARHRFLLGLSIDGPAALHDQYRRDGRGRGSFERVRASAARLRRHGVETNALVLLTDQTAGRLDTVWCALQELGLRHYQFIPCLERDPEDRTRWAPWSVPPEEYGELLCQLFDRWLADFSGGAPQTFVRWFEALLFGYVGQPVPLCELCPTCGGELVVEHDGEVYSCDFFVDDEHRLGNLRDRPLVELLNGEAQRAFGASKAVLDEECQRCRWRRRCNGGCLKDRSRDLTGSGHNPFCVAYRRFFEHADKPLRRLAAQLTGRRNPAPARPR